MSSSATIFYGNLASPYDLYHCPVFSTMQNVGFYKCLYALSSQVLYVEQPPGWSVYSVLFYWGQFGGLFDSKISRCQNTDHWKEIQIRSYHHVMYI